MYVVDTEGGETFALVLIIEDRASVGASETIFGQFWVLWWCGC
jgi:hypothetical protein